MSSKRQVKLRKLEIQTCAHDYVPIESDFIAVTITDVAIQQIIGNVSGGTVQPFGENRTLANVEIVGEKAIVIDRTLPVKLFGDIAPELFGVVNRLLVQFFVLRECGNVRVLREILIGKVDRFFRRHLDGCYLSLLVSKR